MGLATAAVGVVPGYATIGIVGVILLTLLRVLQSYDPGRDEAAD